MEVEGSAVLSISIRFGPKLIPTLCHPDRSGGICSCLNQHSIWTEALPYPLSSRLSRPPRLAVGRAVGPKRSEVEGSAVSFPPAGGSY